MTKQTFIADELRKGDAVVVDNHTFRVLGIKERDEDYITVIAAWDVAPDHIVTRRYRADEIVEVIEEDEATE